MKKLLGKSIAKPVFDFIAGEKTGNIHSIFDRSCNLLIDGKLIGLVISDFKNSPNNIVLSDWKNNFYLGSLVKINRSEILISPDLTIDISLVNIWNPDFFLENKNWKIAAKNLKKIIRSVSKETKNKYNKKSSFLKVILQEKLQDEIEIQFSQKILPFLKEFFSENYSEKNLANNINDLIGLGPGLTPSGDDFLAGIVGVFNCFLKSNSNNIIKNQTTILNQTINLAINNSQTTIISNTLLKSALQGWFCEIVQEFLLILGDELSNDLALKQATEAVIAIGHNSGLDILAGIYVAFMKLEKIN